MSHMKHTDAVVLALWSFAIALTQSCGQSTVCVFLASLLKKKENTVRQRLREWCWDVKDKAGDHRQAFEVAACFIALIRWVLSWWASNEKRLALAIDATTLGQRFVVLTLSIVYRGCAIPVAWVILPANQKKAWKEPWLALLGGLKGAIPADWEVVAFADRGLYAPWLWDAIRQIGWHPFLRINSGGKYRPEGSSEFQLLSNLITQVGESWSGKVTCFKNRPVKATLLACWGEGHEDPWLILTDLEPEQAQVAWYGMRSWIECGFKHIKRAGLQWQNTRMTDPARASRLWLAIAVAILWLVSVGGEADARLPSSGFDALPLTHIARRLRRHTQQPRRVSCFLRGILTILARLLAQENLPIGCFISEAWLSSLPPHLPSVLYPASSIPAEASCGVY